MIKAPIGVKSRPHAGPNAYQPPHETAEQDQLQGGRQPQQQLIENRLAGQPRGAEVAPKHQPHIFNKLRQYRLVKLVSRPDRVDFISPRRRPSQHADRIIVPHAYQHEREQQNAEQDRQRQHRSA